MSLFRSIHFFFSFSPTRTHTHTHTHTHIYINIYMCVCVCVCVYGHVLIFFLWFAYIFIIGSKLVINHYFHSFLYWVLFQKFPLSNIFQPYRRKSCFLAIFWRQFHQCHYFSFFTQIVYSPPNLGTNLLLVLILYYVKAEGYFFSRPSYFSSSVSQTFISRC